MEGEKAKFITVKVHRWFAIVYEVICTSEKPLAVIAKSCPDRSPLPLGADIQRPLGCNARHQGCQLREGSPVQRQIVQRLWVVPTTALSIWTAIAVAETSET
jgi:hypothetical protein